MPKLLRYTRIALSLAIFLIVTVSLTSAVTLTPVLFGWIEQVQLVPAVASMTLSIFIVWLLITLIFGRIYCSSVCPAGTLMDIASRTVRLTRRARARRIYTYQPPATTTRRIFLAVMLLCMIAGAVTIPSVLDPYSAYCRVCHSFLAPLLSLVGDALEGIGITSHPIAVTVTASVTSSIIATLIFAALTAVAAASGRTVCNTVCPVGTTLGFVSRYSIFQIDIDTDRCIQCRKCEHACKARCINLTDHTVDSSRCVVCFDCLPVCPNDAIHYTSRRHRLSIPMMQRTDAKTSGACSAVTGPSSSDNNSTSK